MFLATDLEVSREMLHLLESFCIIVDFAVLQPQSLNKDKQYKRIGDLSVSDSASEWIPAIKQEEKEKYCVGESPVHEPSTDIEDSKVGLYNPS